MDRLLEKQLGLKKRIENSYKNFKKTGAVNMTEGACLSRLENLKELWRTFEKNHEEICEDEEITEDDGYFTNDTFNETDEARLSCLGLFNDYLQKLREVPAQPVPQAAGSAAPEFNQVKLPNIELPIFSGDMKEWVHYRDTFTEMIVKRPGLPNIYKINYLHSSLEGEPLSLLEEVPIAGDSFNDAWKIIKEYYNNSRLLLDGLLLKYNSMKPMENETALEVTRIRTGTKSIMQGLKVLGAPVDQWSLNTVFLTVNRLTTNLQRKWEEKIAKSEQPYTSPSFDELDKFLASERLALVQMESAKLVHNTTSTQSKGENSKKSQNQKRNNSNSSVHVAQEGKPKVSTCALCRGPHFIMHCETFIRKSPAERRKIVTAKHLCYNCLANHMVKNCIIRKRCKVEIRKGEDCGGKHHTLLHLPREDQNTPSSKEPSGSSSNCTTHNSAEVEEKESSDNHSLVPNINCSVALNSENNSKLERVGTILLATAWVYTENSDGNNRLARALVDQGAQSNFISEELCSNLRLKRNPVRIPISGVGGNKKFLCKSKVDFHIRPHFSSTFYCQVTALVIPKITSYNPVTGRDQSWGHLQGLTLADPHYTQTGRIDILLGALVHAQIIEEGLRKGDSLHSPIAMKTLLGWIISGAVTTAPTIRPQASINHQVTYAELNLSLRRFWEIEELPVRGKLLTKEEEQCENHFRRSVSRQEDGRYVVRLPIKENFPISAQLGNSHTPAVKMMLNMEKRFERNPKLKEAYAASIQEYLSLGYMRQVSNAELDFDKCFFLPHHGVIKESSTTTKLRTVFNASSKTNLGYCLNAFLHVGPNLLPELIDLISRWRCYPFVFSADVEKMFLQIFIHPDDQHLQVIVWRGDPEEELLHYFLTTVTFGFASSPFLACRTLRKLAEDEKAEHPLGGQIIEKEVYMDDVLSGGYSLDKAKDKQVDIINLLKKGGFKLRKWLSNHKDLLHLPKELLASEKTLEMESGFSVLGINWCPSGDYFYFRLNLELLKGPITKRTVLSKIAKLFDPLGWIAPVIITSKIFMQSLWISTKEWDTPLSYEQVEFWKNWYTSLSTITQIRIPRWIGVTLSNQVYEIHGFADASKYAYAAVVYLRVIANDTKVTLLGAKTKVAPVKTLSIPRLELCAAQLLAKLTRHFVDTLELPDVQVHLWSDSKDVLFWLRDIPAKWPTFVANRCSEISTLLPDAFWHHIDSKNNPADVASRGISAEEFISHELWWRGPIRLSDTKSSWARVSDLNLPCETSPSQSTNSKNHAKINSASMVVSSEKDTPPKIWDLVKKYSLLPKLIRITVYILRFIRSILDKVSFKKKTSVVLQNIPLPSSIEIQVSETRHAKLVWGYLTQLAYYEKEMNLLRRGEDLPRSHPWKSLNPSIFDGLIRVGGRLKNSDLEVDEKHPVILPHKSRLTLLLIQHYHHVTMHGTIPLILSCLRTMFWILKGRLAVKTFNSNCVKCRRYQAPAQTQMMGDHPRHRVTPARPFLHAGVDYAGPYSLRTSRHRGYKSYKGYFLVFVCFSTKAIHLEVVSSYDTDTFIAAFKRFVSRRGPCARLVSDQGTNLVGADNELRAMFREGSEFQTFVAQDLARNGTIWRFNPPAGAHFGGLWEAAVKSVKRHIKRTVGETIMTFEEFSTLLCQVEACLNSRPLIPLTDDPTDLSVLTPANFLIGEPSLLILEPRITDENIAPLQRWRRTTQMLQRLWDRWSHEYLTHLQKRVKWQSRQPSIGVGDLVLIRHETTPPSRWPLARVIETHEGRDNLVRVVTVRTATTVLKRPVTKLVLLISSQDED